MVLQFSSFSLPQAQDNPGQDVVREGLKSFGGRSPRPAHIDDVSPWECGGTHRGICRGDPRGPEAAARVGGPGGRVGCTNQVNHMIFILLQN